MPTCVKSLLSTRGAGLRAVLVALMLVALMLAGCETTPGGATGDAGEPPADATPAAREAAELERQAEIAFIEEELRVRAEEGRRAPVADLDLDRMRALEAMSTPALEAELERLRRAGSTPAAGVDYAY